MAFSYIRRLDRSNALAPARFVRRPEVLQRQLAAHVAIRLFAPQELE
jgi:hypothetical protein